MEIVIGAVITLAVTVVTWILGEVSRRRELERAARLRREDLERQDRLHLLEARKDAYADCLSSLLRFQRACAHRHAGLRDDESSSDAGLSIAFDNVVAATARARMLRRDPATEAALEAVEEGASKLLENTYVDALLREDLEPLVADESSEGHATAGKERDSLVHATGDSLESLAASLPAVLDY